MRAMRIGSAEPYILPPAFPFLPPSLLPCRRPPTHSRQLNASRRKKDSPRAKQGDACA